ncbi:MAG: hypothetical protein NTX82_05690 [Candidatus Parcubacteria bacterium]|nr:hypothetical protein [Candidatus Parcubacteria bacterium]
MSAEKAIENVSVQSFFEEAARIEVQLDRLNNRHFNYCQETEALKQALANGCRRQTSRQARLNDLQVRLLPQLQSHIDSLQVQKGGGIY